AEERQRAEAAREDEERARLKQEQAARRTAEKAEAARIAAEKKALKREQREAARQARMAAKAEAARIDEPSAPRSGAFASFWQNFKTTPSSTTASSTPSSNPRWDMPVVDGAAQPLRLPLEEVQTATEVMAETGDQGPTRSIMSDVTPPAPAIDFE